MVGRLITFLLGETVTFQGRTVKLPGGVIPFLVCEGVQFIQINPVDETVHLCPAVCGEFWMAIITPIPSTGLVYLPTFIIINQPHLGEYTVHRWYANLQKLWS